MFSTKRKSKSCSPILCLLPRTWMAVLFAAYTKGLHFSYSKQETNRGNDGPGNWRPVYQANKSCYIFDILHIIIGLQLGHSFMLRRLEVNDKH